MKQKKKLKAKKSGLFLYGNGYYNKKKEEEKRKNDKMMLRTHLAISMLFILLFLNQVSNKLIFLIVALIATILPDIDSGFSTIGNYKASKLIQFFVRHRGIIHSLTFCVLISVLLALIFPIISFPFFLGYSLHLLADSFTIDGIMPFWPWRKTSNGFLKTGGRVETSLFVFFLIADLLVFIFLIRSWFV